MNGYQLPHFSESVTDDSGARWVLLGAPGSGKGTQAHFLSDRLGMTHLASGDLFRDHRARGTCLGLKVASYMDQGRLVPDDLVIDMVLERMSRPDAVRGVLLDGFPRTVPQARALDMALAPDGVTIALFIAVSEGELVRRLSTRMTCVQCQSPAGSDTKGCSCQRCGGKLIQRDDDRPEAVSRRFREYESKTSPLLEYYQSQGKLRHVDGERDVEEVSSALMHAIESGNEEVHVQGTSGTI